MAVDRRFWILLEVSLATYIIVIISEVGFHQGAKIDSRVAAITLGPSGPLLAIRRVPPNEKNCPRRLNNPQVSSTNPTSDRKARQAHTAGAKMIALLVLPQKGTKEKV